MLCLVRQSVPINYAAFSAYSNADILTLTQYLEIVIESLPKTL